MRIVQPSRKGSVLEALILNAMIDLFPEMVTFRAIKSTKGSKFLEFEHVYSEHLSKPKNATDAVVSRAKR